MNIDNHKIFKAYSLICENERPTKEQEQAIKGMLKSYGYSDQVASQAASQVHNQLQSAKQQGAARPPVVANQQTTPAPRNAAPVGGVPTEFTYTRKPAPAEVGHEPLPPQRITHEPLPPQRTYSSTSYSGTGNSIGGGNGQGTGQGTGVAPLQFQQPQAGQSTSQQGGGGSGSGRIKYFFGNRELTPSQASRLGPYATPMKYNKDTKQFQSVVYNPETDDYDFESVETFSGGEEGQGNSDQGQGGGGNAPIGGGDSSQEKEQQEKEEPEKKQEKEQAAIPPKQSFPDLPQGYTEKNPAGRRTMKKDEYQKKDNFNKPMSTWQEILKSTTGYDAKPEG